MALSSTIFRFEINLSDVDRNVYAPLAFRCAQHPSENNARMILRILALCLFAEPDEPDELTFGRGLSDPDDAALWQKDPVGDVTLWIDVGAPSANRLHKANKHARRTAVVTDRDDAALKQEWAGKTIHKAEDITVVRFAAQALAAFTEDLPRLVKWTVTHHDGFVHIDTGESNVSLEVVHTTVADIQAASA